MNHGPAAARDLHGRLSRRTYRAARRPHGRHLSAGTVARRRRGRAARRDATSSSACRTFTGRRRARSPVRSRRRWRGGGRARSCSSATPSGVTSSARPTATRRKKVRSLRLRAGLTPMLCVGETLAERETRRNRARGAAAARSRRSPSSTPTRSRRRSSPTSRCGRSAPAARPTPDDASAVHASSARRSHARIGRDADAVPILYGGSVNAGNAAQLLAAPAMWMGCWWAGRVSTPTGGRRSARLDRVS